MNLNNVDGDRRIFRIAVLLLIVAASGNGCVITSATSCEWAYTSLADSGAAATGYDPCAVKDADQVAVKTLFGSERHY